LIDDERQHLAVVFRFFFPSSTSTSSFSTSSSPSSFNNTKQNGGGNPLANLGGLMENMKKAQEEAAKVQKELSE
jgi:hypothetical protein